MTSKLPINNKYGIIDYAIISEEDYNHLKQFKFSKTRGYVLFNKKTLSVYIYYTLMKKDKHENCIVDHINNNPLDNTRSNLRELTYSENTRNRPKKKGCSSFYFGVSKTGDIWRTDCSANYIRQLDYYKNEHHAAHQYNLFVK